MITTSKPAIDIGHVLAQANATIQQEMIGGSNPIKYNVRAVCKATGRKLAEAKNVDTEAAGIEQCAAALVQASDLEPRKMTEEEVLQNRLDTIEKSLASTNAALQALIAKMTPTEPEAEAEPKRRRRRAEAEEAPASDTDNT